MVYKRGYDDDEESYEIAPKHRRQEEDHTAQLSPILENDPCNDGSQRLSSDGEGENSFGESQDERKVSKDMVNESLDGVNSASQYSPFGNTSNYWWFDNKLSDEFSDLNGAHDLSFFPNYFEIDDCVESTGQPEKICETLMDHSSRKGVVPIGPEYQADIPVWSPQDPKNSVSTNIAGTCVIPMPDPESSVFNCELGDQTDRDCTYADNGSIDRVRHVLVARDALREKLGKEVYEELGFCDMGEEVAKKWSEEEQQAFHEVVFSNPISSGKNFWDHLPYVFPSRTKRDHVSYYFNVFMLRIRAEQNRFDPLNTDSDNDEWQGSEFGIMEQGEDSVFESLPSHAAPCNQENYEEDLVEASENKDETNCASLHELNKDETNCASLPELFGKMSNNYKVDQDTQDYSSTLYEDQSEPVNLGILENLVNSDFSS